MADKPSFQDLEKSLAFNRTMVNSIPDLVWIKDGDGVFLGCNKAFEHLYGACEAEILGKTDYDFVERELADFFREKDQKAIQANEPRVNEEWLTFADGGYRGLFETIKSPIRDPQGNLIGVLGVARDITRHKEIEQQLRESEDRFRALHNASYGGIAIHDKGVILECNHGLAEMTGYSTEELVGMDGLLLIAEHDRDMVMKNIVSGLQHPYEATGLRKNGQEFPIQLEARNVPYQGKQVRTVEFRDFTHIKESDQERDRLQNQLNQAQKMESVGLLAGGIAHDFNNLLQVILGYGDLVRDDIGSEHAAYSSLEQMIEAGHRARILISQLLAFSRRQVLDMQEVNLNQAVVEMLKMLRRVMGEHIDLDFRPHPDLRTVRADPSQIGQILTNLCVNARDALSEGGKIIITTEEAEVDETYCKTYPFAKPGTFIVLSVSDNGCGMDPTTLEQVFEPFFTTKEVGEGSGLGLSTVYGLVKQHDGFVQVLSEVDQGSTFKVFLPLAEDGIDKVRDPQTEPILSGTETILLAEDDEMVRMLTTTMLERNGYSVLVSENGEDAISVFDQHAHEIDMVLLDVLMPKLGGRAVFDHVRKTHPHMPALFTSGYNMDAIHTNFVLDEGLALIQKPAKREEMLSKVREVLNRKNSR